MVKKKIVNNKINKEIKLKINSKTTKSKKRKEPEHQVTNSQTTKSKKIKEPEDQVTNSPTFLKEDKDDYVVEDLNNDDFLTSVMKNPLGFKKTFQSIISKLEEIYEDSLESYMIKDFRYFYKQEEPMLLKFNFLVLLSKENFLQDIVENSFQSDNNSDDINFNRKKMFKELYLEYIHTQLFNMFCVPPNKMTIDIIVNKYTETCSNAWLFNETEKMKDVVSRFKINKDLS